MPRPVETLDIALPTDHPLKRPVSSRNKQAAQRIYQLWNVWPWQLFHPSSPHMPTTWTDNLLDKLKTIALCTTLPHALQLLKTNLADSQQLSIAPLNSAIEACKDPNTPHNPVVKNRKRKQDRTIIVQYGSDGYENHQDGTGSSQEDLEEEEEEEAGFSDDHDEVEIRELRLRRRPQQDHLSRRARGKSLPNGYGLPGKPKAPPSKRPKHRHSTALDLAETTTPAHPRLPFSPRLGVSATSSRQRFDSEGPTRPSHSGGVASYIESAIGHLSSSFKEKFHGAEQTVDDARAQLRAVEARLAALEGDLGEVKKDIAELEKQKSEMENTHNALLVIEKQEEELAARRRELMMRRISVNWRPSSSMSCISEQPQPQPSLGIARASDDLLTEIDGLVADQLQPRREHEVILRTNISNTKTEIKITRAKLDASVANLGAKSDELIRWRGFSSDVEDALVRRGFAELGFMRDFGQSHSSSQNLYAGLPSTLDFSRAATVNFLPEPNSETGVAGMESTPVSQSADNDFELGRRRESV